ncbi:MAG: hypothetical protein WC889_20125, partial [Myxococcota bacterium]
MRRYLIVLFACTVLALTACASENKSGGDGGPDGGKPADGGRLYPDPAFIFEVRNAKMAVTDTPYPEAFSDQFRTTDRLATLDVRALSHLVDSTWAATADGLFRRGDDGNAFVRVSLSAKLPPTAEEIVRVSREAYGKDGLVAVATPNSVVTLTRTGEVAATYDFEFGPVTAVAAHGENLIAGTSTSIFRWNGAKWQQTNIKMIINARDLAITQDDMLLVATPAGVLIFDAGDISAPEDSWTKESGDLADDDVRAVTACGDTVVVASTSGIAVHRGKSVTLLTARVGGLPTDKLLSIDCNADGFMIGHEIGTSWISADLSIADHYISPRWIPDNRVPAVALGAGTDRWAGTLLGASRIHFVTRTLVQKERVFNSTIPYYWRMDGVTG